MRVIKYLFLLLLLYSAGVCANDLPQWIIVPSESNLSFTGTQNNAPISGTFKDFSGTIFADLNRYQESSIDIVVNINSLTTSYAELKSLLLGKDWFNAQEFPKAEFKAAQFNKKDEKHYEAVGTLTIKNKSALVTLTFTAIESPKNHLLIEGNTTIKRSTFAIGQGEWAKSSEIKDEVTVNFKVVATRKEQ